MNFTRLIRCPIIIMILLLPVVAASQPAPFSGLEDTLELRLQEGYFTGISMAYLDRSGEVTFYSMGHRGPSKQQPVDERTVYEIGSVTKTFTALLLAQMDRQGELNLHDPISAFLPDSLDLPGTQDQPIRLEHLATHTSGLSRLPSNLSPRDPADPYADYTVSKLYRYLEGATLQHSPGNAYAYSNLGMGLLGHILERHAGRSYEELARDMISRQIGMQQTGISLSPSDTTLQARPTSYGRLVKAWNLGVLAGAGGLRSSTKDMAAYLSAVSGSGPGSLEEAAEMTRRSYFSPDRSHHQEMGLAWFISTEADTIFWHGGGTGGFRAFAGFNQEDGTGAVILSNGTGDINDLGLHLLDRRNELRQVRRTEEVPRERLRSYAGTYRTPQGLIFKVRLHEEGLRVQLPGQPEHRVFADSETRFFYRVVPAEIEFYGAKSEPADSLTLYQNGQEITAERMGGN
ncbi:MAG: serine hydrolase [Balneolaceae bacterium]|nr:serine hydrolase [Balneolaceae bacterium]